jgi:RNA polymerase sigma-70 factor (ECF subfamily)
VDVAPQPEILMVNYQRGDAMAAGLLVDTLSPQFFRFFLGQTRNRESADDLLQDFWLRIHQARHTYRPAEPLLPWMYAIARRVRIDRYRRTKNRSGREIRVEKMPDVPSPVVSEAGDVDFERLLAALPESQREVIVMLKVSGLSVEEVARATGSSAGSVKQKAHRAYEKLRTILKGAGHAI